MQNQNPPWFEGMGHTAGTTLADMLAEKSPHLLHDDERLDDLVAGWVRHLGLMLIEHGVPDKAIRKEMYAMATALAERIDQWLAKGGRA
jgi:hypothetical protein